VEERKEEKKRLLVPNQKLVGYTRRPRMEGALRQFESRP